MRILAAHLLRHPASQSVRVVGESTRPANKGPNTGGRVDGQGMFWSLHIWQRSAPFSPGLAASASASVSASLRGESTDGPVDGQRRFGSLFPLPHSPTRAPVAHQPSLAFLCLLSTKTFHRTAGLVATKSKPNQTKPKPKPNNPRMIVFYRRTLIH
ncbi:hypothetical protein VFPFJ_06017 [Purpureocillium lilacinum]|uniref:Uncharacterized protein n=1 Tax=Purpureocillium lilacinum TaxID=33203 RepID=A0A179HJL2_PURLI|nr:hypothetical protein VFPFJ_06017 [Purpureocillium lilacinum]OAQ85058.1 hypothetical protein VFPBJ_03831 [Purpureocillium lilacinum]OAQ89603.1 hypothetical protein VFPFJ_06017 [Purpureocillium lilacinum]